MVNKHISLLYVLFILIHTEMPHRGWEIYMDSKIIIQFSKDIANISDRSKFIVSVLVSLHSIVTQYHGYN